MNTFYSITPFCDFLKEIALQIYQCPFDSETINRSIDLTLDSFTYV